MLQQLKSHLTQTLYVLFVWTLVIVLGDLLKRIYISLFGFCPLADIPVVRNISELGQDSYGRPGLSHMTIAGAVHHGMREVCST